MKCPLLRRNKVQEFFHGTGQIKSSTRKKKQQPETDILTFRVGDVFFARIICRTAGKNSFRLGEDAHEEHRMFVLIGPVVLCFLFTSEV